MALLRAGALQLQSGSDAIGPAEESWHGTVCRIGRLAGADLDLCRRRRRQGDLGRQVRLHPGGDRRDPRHAKAALALQLNKSDRNDARGLAQIVRTGWYREVVVKSVDSHLVRSLLTTRAQLVRMRVDLANQIRGVLKPFGLIAGKGGGRPFAERVRALVAGGPLQEVAGALLMAWQALGEQIAVLSRRLVAMARQDEAVRRLMTAP